MYSVVETLKHYIPHAITPTYKDVQNSKNKSSGQNFTEKRDEFGVKLVEIKEKIEEACDENLSLRNLFTYKKLKLNHIFHNVIKKIS